MSNPKSGSKKYAVRNLRLCTKDCLCLYVCPTGATDTENSIIDVAKCIGCGDCADSCPSGAITMMPYELPEQQPKDDKVTDANRRLILSKAEAENLASQIPGALGKAIERSSRLMAEDLCREAGFMLPQSRNAKEFLKKIRSYPGVPKEADDSLLNSIEFHEGSSAKETEEKWKCSVCGYVHTGKLSEYFTCPICGQPHTAFERIQ